MKSSCSLGAVLVAGPLFLSACASLPPDGGRVDVARLVADRGAVLPDKKAEADIAALVADKIAMPLTADSAVAIAYLQNPRLRAAYARLGVAAADVYDAGRLSNPRLSVELLFGNAISGDNLTFGLSQSFSDLLFLRARTRIARADYASATAAAGQEILDVAAEVQRGYVRFVAAQQTAQMRGKIADAAAVAAELAARFHAAGNINRLQVAIEDAAASDARLAQLAAQDLAETAYADLNRLMGFRGEGEWAVSTELQVPDQLDLDAEDIVQKAMTARLDLVARREAITARAAAHGLSRSLRWVNGDIGVAHEREEGGGRRTGPSLSLELPIFNSGQGRVARAAAELEQAVADLAEAEITIANHIRANAARLESTRARAEEFGGKLLPARRAIVARMQEEVNFMLRGPFDLMRARVQEYEASENYIAAVRDYWIARIDLAREAGGRLPAVPATDEQKQDMPAQMDHEHMNHGDHQ